MVDIGAPILVVVDIDRLQPAELLDLLKVVRLLGRFHGVDFLLAYDERTIVETLLDPQRGKVTASRPFIHHDRGLDPWGSPLPDSLSADAGVRWRSGRRIARVLRQRMDRQSHERTQRQTVEQGPELGFPGSAPQPPVGPLPRHPPESD
jgi:hypothetical protein